ncbi:hypothetical protein B566_EDAN011208 [Ephemera danica]|nr:hypothetical protein B566_EDAN011208 [Ephemera danica]
MANHMDVGFNLPHTDPEFKCTKFCKCDWGGAKEFDCPMGLHFREDTGTCDWPVEVGFNIPHPEFKCNKFCKCAFGGAVEFDCPDDLHFDQLMGICNWRVSANCDAILPYENCPPTN